LRENDKKTYHINYVKILLVNETNALYTSIDPYRLPLTFTLFFYSESSSSNDY